MDRHCRGYGIRHYKIIANADMESAVTKYIVNADMESAVTINAVV